RWWRSARRSAAIALRGWPQPLAEDRKVEHFARTEPDHMLGVVGEVLAGLGMGEDRQRSAVQREELRYLSESLRRHRQLDAPARVRADRPQVEMADRDGEASLRRRG